MNWIEKKRGIRSFSHLLILLFCKQKMSLLAAFHLAVGSGLLLFAFSSNGTPNNDIFQHFKDYMQRYNKSYEVGTMEFKKRETIFEVSKFIFLSQALKPRWYWKCKHNCTTISIFQVLEQYSFYLIKICICARFLIKCLVFCFVFNETKF